jgi:hypothetical protein
VTDPLAYCIVELFKTSLNSFIVNTLGACIIKLFTGIEMYIHGRTSADRTNPGPSLQLHALTEQFRPNLELKTRSKQLLGYLPLVIALPVP